MWGYLRLACLVLATALGAGAAASEPLPREALEGLVVPPMSMGEALNDKGVYALLNSGGAQAGYVFETEPMAPLPGFSGAPVNMLVTLDLEGRFLDVRLISHNEPIFVSGLPEKLFHDFFEQYRGHSISDTLVVGSPYGDASEGSALVYLDGVTKATASVRIAHESLLAAALQVAREKMGGIASGPPAYPDPDHDEALSWDDLLAQGLVGRRTVTNAEIDAAFEGTAWADDDPEAQADPDAPYMDLWVVDLGPPSIARAVLSDAGRETLSRFQEISGSDEPILVIETARHGLVSPDFVRNTAPDWVSAEQDGFPIALRDADLLIGLNDALPAALHDAVDRGAGLILRTDRRLGFDPARDWTLHVKAIREHGVFKPEIGAVTLDLQHRTDARFFARVEAPRPVPPWLEAIRGRQGDLLVLAVFLAVLLPVLLWGQSRLAGLRAFVPVRLGVLAFVAGFIGWWGQGQLSIVTPLATLRAAIDGSSLAFLVYDPFSLLVWAAAIVGFVLWGRGLFCGWLCPFGALQTFTGRLGRWLGLPQIDPGPVWDNRLKAVKYVALAGLVGVALFLPDRLEKAAEIEPFKTAITTFFLREWYFTAYAVFWLGLSMVLYKGFCRYLCPLGALMAIGGMIRTRRWIPRRSECGTPCQLCRVRCRYGAIKPTGQIVYSECFQCLDCVTIHDDRKQCVPLILADRQRSRPPTIKVAAQ